MVCHHYSLLIPVTTILLCSRLNALITCHQISEELPLSWLDTPFQLPFPRNNPSLPPASPNLSLAIIPSHFNPHCATQEAKFTTYRLLPDLSLVGDVYVSKDTEIENFVSGSSFSQMNLENSSSEEESETEEWRPFESNWIVDVTSIAKQLVSIPMDDETISRQQIDEIRTKLMQRVVSQDIPFQTMYSRFWFGLISGSMRS